MSYDDTATTGRFASKWDIAFPLLSDPESATIDAYGVRNHELEGSRVDGVPHPGTVIVDRDGVIRAKLFKAGYEQRHGADSIIEAAAEID